MSETETTNADAPTDLEKGDHAVKGKDVPESHIQGDNPTPNSKDESLSGDAKDEDLSRLDTALTEIDEFDPFALYPDLAITMSSTRGPGIMSRRNTVTTLGRSLTRQETLQTLKSIRSRVTEVRDEFDENVSLPSENLSINHRTIFLNLLQLMRILLLLMDPKIH